MCNLHLLNHFNNSSDMLKYNIWCSHRYIFQRKQSSLLHNNMQLPSPSISSWNLPNFYSIKVTLPLLYLSLQGLSPQIRCPNKETQRSKSKDHEKDRYCPDTDKPGYDHQHPTHDHSHQTGPHSSFTSKPSLELSTLTGQ